MVVSAHSEMLFTLPMEDTRYCTDGPLSFVSDLCSSLIYAKRRKSDTKDKYCMIPLTRATYSSQINSDRQ